MFKSIVTCLTFICLSANVYAQTKSNFSPIGTWWDEEKKGKTEIYAGPNGKLYGKITWIKDPNDPKTHGQDVYNPDKSKQSRPLVGLVVVLGLVKNSNGEYDGSVYNPKDGRTYSGTLTMLGENKLRLRGYVGIKLLGKTEIWERVK